MNDVADERGYVAALFDEHEFREKTFSWIAEFVHLDNAEGTMDDLSYLTIGGALTSGRNYNISISGTDRARNVVGGADLDDYSIQISAGKEFENGWTADIGYKYFVDADVENHTIGLLFTKTFSVSTAD